MSDNLPAPSDQIPSYQWASGSPPFIRSISSAASSCWPLPGESRDDAYYGHILEAGENSFRLPAKKHLCPYHLLNVFAPATLTNRVCVDFTTARNRISMDVPSK